MNMENQAGVYVKERKDALCRTGPRRRQRLSGQAYEPCTIADIKVYKPEAKSIGSGQVLSSAYSSEKAKVVV